MKRSVPRYFFPRRLPHEQFDPAGSRDSHVPPTTPSLPVLPLTSLAPALPTAFFRPRTIKDGSRRGRLCGSARARVAGLDG